MGGETKANRKLMTFTLLHVSMVCVCVCVHVVPASNGDKGQPTLSQRAPSVLAALTQNRGFPWPYERAESYHSQGGPRQCYFLYRL